MSANCKLTLKVRGSRGPLAGVAIAIASCYVDGSRETDYETTVASNSNGEIVFNVPQGSQLKFASSDVSEIDGWEYTAPGVAEIFVGQWFPDTLSEPEVFTRSFVAKTADHVITAAESGTIFTNEGAESNISLQLPPAATCQAGKTRFAFCVVTAEALLTFWSDDAQIAFQYNADGSMGRSVAVGSSESDRFIDVVWDGTMWRPVAQVGLWSDQD